MAMNIKNQESTDNQAPTWLLSLFSLLVGCGALWYAWLQYNDLVGQSHLDWYLWIRPVFMLLVGILCILATALFTINSPSAWSVFMGGLSIIPLMLFSNLIVLICRVIQNIFQGDTDPFLSRLSTSPLKVILNIIVVVIVLSVIQWIKKNENNN
jgi:hypothetical protein